MELELLPNPHNRQNVFSTKSFAYKIIYIENGLVVLFEKLRPFNEANIKLKLISSDLFLELGNNVMLITEDMIRHLITSGNLFLYEAKDGIYEAKNCRKALSADSQLMAKIEGAWQVLKERGRHNERV